MSRWSGLPPPLRTTSPSSSSSPRHLPSSSPRSLGLTAQPSSLTPSSSHFYRSSSHTDSKPHHPPPPHPFTYIDDDDELPSHSTLPPPPRPLRLTPTFAPIPSPTTPSQSHPSPPSHHPRPLFPPLSHWEVDESVDSCPHCTARFSLFLRKHHCRACGRIFCDAGSRHRQRVNGGEELVRVCDSCNAHIVGQDGVGPPLAASAASPAPPPPATTPLQWKKTRSTTDPPMPAMQLNPSPPSLLNQSPPPSLSQPSTPTAPPLVTALVQELRCMEEVMQAERAIREEVEAMLLVVAREVLERAGGGGAVEGEVERLRRRVEELEGEVAALRAAAVGQAGVR